MHIALLCVLIAGLMPYLWTAVAKVLGSRAAGKRFDNSDVRAWQATLSGQPQRAHAAHLNSFEAFPFFAAAVLAAIVTGADGQRLMLLSVAYVVLRVLYGIAYLADLASLRSLIWFAALVCAVAIFISAISAVVAT